MFKKMKGDESMKNKMVADNMVFVVLKSYLEAMHNDTRQKSSNLEYYRFLFIGNFLQSLCLK